MSWTTALVPGESGATYSYPLGTGDSWSHPIEMTRIYVVAPPGIDFSVEYPELGVESSGYARQFGGYVTRITDYQKIPAYAVDEAVGDFGRVWRVTYTQSNSAEDIVITARPQSFISKVHMFFQKGGGGLISFIFGLIVALAFWIMGWRYLMPRWLGESYQGGMGKLLKYALIYVGVNIVLIFPGMILYLFWYLSGSAMTFIPLLILFGGASVLIFAVWHIKRLGTDAGKTVKAFVLVTLASNGAYLIISLIYAKFTGIM